jgi:hypothetical protein
VGKRTAADEPVGNMSTPHSTYKMSTASREKVEVEFYGTYDENASSVWRGDEFGSASTGEDLLCISCKRLNLAYFFWSGLEAVIETATEYNPALDVYKIRPGCNCCRFLFTEVRRQVKAFSLYVEDDEQDEEPESELCLSRISLYKGVKPRNRYAMNCICIDAVGRRHHTSFRISLAKSTRSVFSKVANAMVSSSLTP